jgi:hypothetical protein
MARQDPKNAINGGMKRFARTFIVNAAIEEASLPYQIPFRSMNEENSAVSCSKAVKKGSAILPDFHSCGLAGVTDRQIAGILDRMRDSFRTFQM